MSAAFTLNQRAVFGTMNEPGAALTAPALVQTWLEVRTMSNLTRTLLDYAIQRYRKVDVVESGCWLWTGSLDPSGYGKTSAGPLRNISMHRLSYMAWSGEPIPAGLELDHLCRVRHCVNPAHLEPVTKAVNQQRGSRATAETCPQGHQRNDTRWANGHRALCVECAQSRRAAMQIIPGDGDRRHGTISGYSNCKCRCPECRAAGAAYRRRNRVDPL